MIDERDPVPGVLELTRLRALLSPGECDVLELSARGFTNTESAAVLELSDWTLKEIRQGIRNRGLGRYVGAVAIATRIGAIDPLPASVEPVILEELVAGAGALTAKQRAALVSTNSAGHRTQAVKRLRSRSHAQAVAIATALGVIDPRPWLPRLAPRYCDSVVVDLARGLTPPQIAARDGRPIPAVEEQIEAAVKGLGAQTGDEAAAIAVAGGLVPGLCDTPDTPTRAELIVRAGSLIAEEKRAIALTAAGGTIEQTSASLGLSVRDTWALIESAQRRLAAPTTPNLFARLAAVEVVGTEVIVPLPRRGDGRCMSQTPRLRC